MSSEKVTTNVVSPGGEGLVCSLPSRRLNRRNCTGTSWSTKRRIRDNPGVRTPPALLATNEKESTTTTTGTETRRGSLKRRTATSRRLLNKVLRDPANIGVFGALVVTTTVDAFLNFFDQVRDDERIDQGLDPDPLLEGEEEDQPTTMEAKSEIQEFVVHSDIQPKTENEIKDIDVQMITEQDPKNSVLTSNKDSTLKIEEVELGSLKTEKASTEESKKPVNIDSSVVPTSGAYSLFNTGMQPLQERATIKQKERVPVRKEASLLSPSILRRSPTDSTGPGSRGNDPRNEGKRKPFSTVVKKEEGDRIGSFRNDMIPVIAGILFGIVAFKWITGTVFSRRTQIDPTTTTSVIQVQPPTPKKSIYDEYEAFDESDLELDDYGKDEGDENEY